jgi:hypothetical protein
MDELKTLVEEAQAKLDEASHLAGTVMPDAVDLLNSAIVICKKVIAEIERG